MSAYKSPLLTEPYVWLLRLARQNIILAGGDMPDQLFSEIEQVPASEFVDEQAHGEAKEHMTCPAKDHELVKVGGLARETSASPVVTGGNECEQPQHGNQKDAACLEKEVPASPLTTSSASRSALVGEHRQTKRGGKEKAHRDQNPAKKVTADVVNMSESLLVLGTTEVQYEIRPLPRWYIEIAENSYQMKQLSKKRTPTLTALDALKACIASCHAQNKPDQRSLLYEKLRDHVHKAEIALPLTKYLLKKTKIFNPDTGLPAIFKPGAAFPPDLKADSYQLYCRWYVEDFEQDLLRGIIVTKANSRNADRIDTNYQSVRAAHPTTSKFYGQGNLVQGQWWPTQLCAVRDHAHGAVQGGISGEKDKGAYSIVLSGGSGYHDRDFGHTIYYCGTASKDSSAPTENTNHLVASIELQNVVRVLRSHQLPKSNPYRPRFGLRYDGLYTVQKYEVLDAKRLLYSFRLERCRGQGDIRCGDDAARRPTRFEEQAWLDMGGR